MPKRRRALQNNPAVALKAVRDDRLGDVVKGRGGRVDHLLQIGRAQRDEHQQVPPGQPAQVLHHQIGGDGVDEFGHDDDQAAPVQAAEQVHHPEGEVGLLGAVVESRQAALDPGEGADALLGHGEVADPRIETEGADPVARPKGGIGDHQGGVDGVVQLGDAGQGFAHQMAGVDRQDDGLAAVALELLADQRSVLCRLLPVHGAQVEAGKIVAHGRELRAVALQAVRLEPEHGVPAVELDRHGAHGADVGDDVDRPVDGDAMDQLDQPDRPAPADPDTIDGGPAAPLGLDRDLHLRDALRHRADGNGRGWGQGRRRLAQQLAAMGRCRLHDLQGDDQPGGAADMDGVGGPDMDAKSTPRRRQGHVEAAKEGQDRHDHGRRQPIVRRHQADDDARGHAEGQQEDGTRGRPHQRGAGT